MTTKSKSAKKSALPSTSKTLERETVDAVRVRAILHSAVPSAADRRKELLARVAGSVVAGLVTSPSPSITKSEDMATVAVDIAEEILKKAGFPSVDAAEASSSSSTPVGAAS